MDKKLANKKGFPNTNLEKEPPSLLTMNNKKKLADLYKYYKLGGSGTSFKSKRIRSQTR